MLNTDGALNSGTFDEWTPIGNKSNPYTGTFDGGNNTINGLCCNDTNANYVGLFGYVGASGTVQNVTVADSWFKANNYVGGVSGQNDEGTLTNCTNSGKVTDSAKVGGVCSNNSGTATLTNCYYQDANETDSLDGTTAKTATQFASGEVAWLLDTTGLAVGSYVYTCEVTCEGGTVTTASVTFTVNAAPATPKPATPAPATPAPAASIDTTISKFTVNAWVNVLAGGTVSPMGSTTYTQGGSVTYTITPAAGYRIAKVTVDGVNIGAVSSYTFKGLNRNHEIGAYFETTSGTAGSTIPQTSDSAPLLLWAVLMALAAAGACTTVLLRRKRHK